MRDSGLLLFANGVVGPESREIVQALQRKLSGHRLAPCP